jgi:hypothetical protein
VKKNDTNTKLILAESLENSFDNVVLATTETVIEVATKSFPIVSAVKGLFNGISTYNENKRMILFLSLVRECEQQQAGKILEIFQNKNNIEMGGEIINALENSYLEKQAKMIARSALLYDAKEIDRSKFLKLTHIIPKLTSFLLEQLANCYALHLERKNTGNYRIFNSDCDGAGQELTSFGFLIAVATMGGGDFYKGTEELEFFYNYIMNNRYGRE